MSTPLVTMVLTIMLLAAPTAAAQPSPPIDVTGATYAEFDESAGLWVLRGNPVVVTRGTTSVRAPSITYDARQQIVRGTGGVTFTDPSATIESAQATAWLQEERLLAEGQVQATFREGGQETHLRGSIFEAWRKERRAIATGNVQIRRGEFTLSSNRVEYLETQQKALAMGRSTITAPEGHVTADRIEAFLDREEAEASGSVEISLRPASPGSPGNSRQRISGVVSDPSGTPIEGQAPKAVMRRRDRIAILSGGATVRQGQNTATALEITIDLRNNKVVASGQAHVVVYPGR